MGYYLLDRQNPNAPTRDDGHRFWGYPSRRDTIDLLILHTAEALPDFVAPDPVAEAVAHYGATTSRPASWHSTVDSDSTIPMLPDAYTAFHCVDFNARGWGLEIATQASKWSTAPEAWVARVLDRAATEFALRVRAYHIPVRRLTSAAQARTGRGLVAHADLDPTRRTDPGHDFPWDRFLALVAKKAAAGAVTASEGSEGDALTDRTDDQVKKLFRSVLNEATVFGQPDWKETVRDVIVAQLRDTHAEVTELATAVTELAAKVDAVQQALNKPAGS